MFILKVNTKTGTQQSDFKTHQEAIDHFEKYKVIGYWGKEEYIVRTEEQIIEHPSVITVSAVSAVEEVKDELGVIIIPAKAAIPEEVTLAWTETTPAFDTTIPCEYTWVIEDHTAEESAKKTAHEAKVAARFDRVTNLKSIDWTKIDTIAELKAITKHLVNEVLKDE